MKVAINARTIKMCRNFALSSGAIAGTMYCCQQAGVWGTPEETANLITKIKVRMHPKLQESFPNEILKMPSISDSGEMLREQYNRGIKKSFDFINKIPTHTKNLGVVLVEACSEKVSQLVEFYRARKQADGTQQENEDILRNKMQAKTEVDNCPNQENVSGILQIEDNEHKREADEQNLLVLSSFL